MDLKGTIRRPFVDVGIVIPFGIDPLYAPLRRCLNVYARNPLDAAWNPGGKQLGRKQFLRTLRPQGDICATRTQHLLTSHHDKRGGHQDTYSAYFIDH